MRLVSFADVAGFARRAEEWLLEREPEHNLLLGIIGQLRSGRHSYEAPLFLATVENDERVCGCVFRTPPFALGMTDIPIDAIPTVIDSVAEVYTSIPAIVGPPGTVQAAAEQWSQKMSVPARLMMNQRIYVLEHVRWPAAPPPGSARPATPDDLPLVLRWAEAFVRDAHVGGVGQPGLAMSLIDDKSLFLWEDGGPRSMAAARGGTPNGIRVGFVYTPDEYRGRGYASAVVAAVSQRQLDAGRKFCFLYTDLANPTSNSIYQKLGYDPVGDSLMMAFD